MLLREATKNGTLFTKENSFSKRYIAMKIQKNATDTVWVPYFNEESKRKNQADFEFQVSIHLSFEMI